MFNAPPGATVLVFASMALFVPFAFLAFSAMRPTVAVVVVLLAGDLFLPELASIDFPGLPPIGKSSLPYLAVLAAALTRDSARLRAARFGRGLEWIGLLWVLGSLGTVLTNTDQITYSRIVRPGLTLIDWPTASLDNVIRYALPAFLGRAYVRSGRDLRDLLRWTVVGGAICSAIALIELRMSPQMHRWTYGYHPGGFELAVRYGGYRPMGYMQHGLALTIFLLTAQISASSLARAGLAILPFRGLTLGGGLRHLVGPAFAGLIAVCKSIGTILYSAVALLTMLLAPLRLVVLASALLCAAAIVYPLLRSSPSFPADEIISWIRSIDAERAHSLWSRFENEDGMLALARKRYLFGWGGYGRNWVVDPVTGQELTAPDGFWVIQLSAFGVVGFLCAMLLHAAPVIGLTRVFGRIRGLPERALLAGLALAVSLRLADLVPNGFFTAFPVFLAGALSGSMNGILAEQARAPTRRAPEVEERRANPVPIARKRWSDLEPENGKDA